MRFADYLEEIRPALGELSDTVLVFERLPSTNEYARYLLSQLRTDEASPPSFVLLAFEQTSGRGRRGRRWVGPPGGLYASWVVPLEPTLRRAALPLVCAAAFCRAVRDAGVGACEIKWPNDLMVRGRKMGGILIELPGSPAGSGRVAVIGCGLNVRSIPSELAGVEATSLVAEGAETVEFGNLLAAMNRRLEKGMRHADDSSGTLEHYRELLAHRPGDRLRCTVGRRQIEGRFVDLDPDGGLRIVSDGEEVSVGAGEVIES